MQCMLCKVNVGEMHAGKCNPENKYGLAWLVIFEDTFMEFEVDTRLAEDDPDGFDEFDDSHLDDVGD